MMAQVTHGERLARIETILERIETKIEHIETAQTKDIADLAQLKNRGIGLLIGVGLAGGAAGAAVSRFWTAIFG